MKKIVWSLVLFLSLGATTLCDAQVNILDHNPVIDSLQAVARNTDFSLVERLESVEKSESLSIAANYRYGIFMSLLLKAHLKALLHRAPEGLSDLNKARDMATKEGKSKWQLNAAAYSAIFYQDIDQFEKVVDAYNYLLSLAEKYQNPQYSLYALSNLGIYYEDHGMGVQSEAHARRALKIAQQLNSVVDMARAYQGISYGLVLQKKYEPAQVYLDSFKTYFAQIDSFERMYIFGLKTIQGFIYKGQKKYDKAIQLLSEAADMHMEFETGVCRALAEIFRDMNDKERETQYLYRIIHLDSVKQRTIKKANLANLESVYQLELQTQRATELKQRQSWLLGTSVIAVVLLGLLGFIFYLRQRNNRTERLLLESQLKLKEQELRYQQLQQSQMEELLRGQKEDLTNLALTVSQKNEVAEQIKSRLEQISSNPQNIRQNVEEAVRWLDQNLRLNEDVQQFQQRIDDVNQLFFNKLSERFPNLTLTEKQLCGHLRLGLSSKEIALVRGVAVSSVEISRHRLRKKLNLSHETDLVAFIQSI